MSAPLRVALLSGAADPSAVSLTAALAAMGQEAVLLSCAPHPAGVPSIRLRPERDRSLRFRFIGDGLAHVPHAWLALARGRFAVAHAFSPVDALAAVAWARRAACPAALTFVEPLTRETIANRRARLTTLERAAYGADAVLAVNQEVRGSLRRMLALDATVLDPADADGHLALYRQLGAH